MVILYTWQYIEVLTMYIIYIHKFCEYRTNVRLQI